MKTQVDQSKIAPSNGLENGCTKTLFIHFLKVENVRNIAQNLHWKLGQQAPSFGTILAFLETMA